MSSETMEAKRLNVNHEGRREPFSFGLCFVSLFKGPHMRHLTPTLCSLFEDLLLLEDY